MVNRRSLRTLAIVLWWCVASCAPEGNGPPPAPSTTTTPVDPPPTTTAPEPPPEPPPEPDGPRPSDYIKIVRVPAILGWQSSANVGLIKGAQTMSFAGWRDPLKVLTNCRWAFEGENPYLGMTPEQAIAFAEDGFDLTRQAEDNFIPRFPAVNRRCDVNHKQHDPDFCEVTNIRKSAWAPFGALGNSTTPRGSFWTHLDRAHNLANLAGRCRSAIASAGGRGYDSIAGWCSALNDLGWTAEDCR